MEEIIHPLFNRKPYGEQPNYIVDIGCGAGTLLEKIYRVIKNETLRGKVLNQYPLKLIGVDFNEKVLAETAFTLKDIDHMVLKGDTGDPRQVMVDLKKMGIHDTENILYVRSFPDHDRPYTAPPYIAAGNTRSDNPGEVVNANGVGKDIPPRPVIEGLVEYFKRWFPIIGRHGLVIQVDRYLEPKTVGEGFPRELPVEVDRFLMAAAEAGLFPRQEFPGKHSKMLPYSRMTFIHLERREYRVRFAREKDLPALVQLEKQCWPPGLRKPLPVLKKRLKRYPQGQLALELGIDNKVVGAVYSQRISNIKDLETAAVDTVERLHREEGPVVQLLAVNILPGMQDRNLGDQLLEFMLQRCALMNAVHKVIGVTRCKDYHKHVDISPQDYIHLRNQQGRLVDTILRFHQLHGAQIKRLVPNYRPRDKKNKGYGVLVEYDITHRRRNEIEVNGKYPAEDKKTGTVEKTETIKDFIVKTIISILGMREDEFSLERPLMEMGFDSAHLLDLNERICCKYKIPLEAAFFFKYNTAARIISYLQEQSNQSYVKANDTVSVIRDSHTPPLQKEEIAIVGVACRLPGGITDKEKLWELLTSGKDVIGKVPPQRWCWPAGIDPGVKHKGIDRGGFLEEIADFDASFFRISPKEAVLMDPQQRILLELSWECLEDAGYPAKAVSGSKTGVFIGASGSDYNTLLNKHIEEIEAHFGLGTSMAVLSNRISYFYDFFGPSIQIDTACSSSLTAVHEAIKSLQVGECQQALVGGINIICHPSTSIAYYKAGMLSKDGRCKTFDKEANGYVRGEGGVMILLKPLAQALRDRDSIYAVIKGSAINHGGQASGLTVPNPAKQAALLVEAYKTAGVEPGTVGYIEAHGTGTSLGDPIEFNGLQEAFSQLAKTKEETREPFCGLGSIKTNLGHLEAAAGIAGLLKVVLSLQHQKLPASLNFKQLNPHITLANTPFYIVDKNQPWELLKGQVLRRAGVSSFGSGGTNAHVVLEEAPTVNGINTKKKNSYLICLSAKTGEALREKQQDLLRWLEKKGQQANLDEISATLLLGREHFKIKAVYIARNVQELKEKLGTAPEKGHIGGYSKEKIPGTVNQPQPLLKKVGQAILSEMGSGKKMTREEYDKKLVKLAELYVKGYDLDWKSMFADSKGFRISLPTYPFARKRYWIAWPGSKSKSAAGSAFREKSPSAIVQHSLKSMTAVGASFFNIPAKPVGISLQSLPGHQKSPGNPVGKARQSITLSSLDRSLPITPPGIDEEFQRGSHVPGPIPGKLLQEELRISLAEVLKVKQIDVDADDEFIDMGLDPVKSLEWIQSVNQKYGTSITAARIYDYPSLGEFSDFLEKELNNQISQPPGKQVISAKQINSFRSPHWSDSLQEELAASLADVLAMNRSELDVDEKFVDLGMDSIIGVEWTNALKEHYGIAIKAVKVYDYPTLREFAGFLEKELKKHDSQSSNNPVAADPIQSSAADQFPKPGEDSHREKPGETVPPPVVDLHEIEPGIVQLTMQDRVHKNMFSKELLQGLLRSFDTIRADSNYKVVILTGYDGFFSSGGTKEILFAIQEGKMKFTDINVFNLPLDCNIPVIAAMQGHGIGAGWALGMFCDFIVMSRDSIYTSNYMKLGFTPGAGATLIFPEKLGISLAQEILFTGKNYRGKDLEAKGVPFPILPKKEVLTYAVQLAKTLAQSPRESLIALKDNMAAAIRDKVSGAFEKEVAMHDRTFVNRAEAKERIQSLFGESSTNDNKNNPSIHPVVSKSEAPYPGNMSMNGSLGDSIAIIGMSGQFPRSKNLAAFWNNLAHGVDCISEIPASRWSIDRYYDPDPEIPGKSIGKWMGVLEDVDKFDPLFFNISPAEAKAMDPQQRLFLENCWHCIEDSGLSSSSLNGSRCGVFVGCGTGDYGQYLGVKGLNAHRFMGGSISILSARISYVLNLKGPSLAIDTACSSSLVAITEACNSLVLQTSDLALAGGVFVMAGPAMHIMTGKAGMLSADGRCFTFDDRANGFVPGEGVGVILLKRYRDAIRDQDSIYGVIRGWGINQDGKTNGITAPSVNSQILLEKEVYNRFGINPETISFVETHGTGTKLGDPIEVDALTESFQFYTSKKNYCALGSVKSNIGHLVTAAGAAGVLKTLLALKHRMLPPQIHFETLNRHIDLDNSPFYINTELKSWEVAPGTPRRAAVSSFGFSGTNAHLVIEEYLPGTGAAGKSLQIDTTQPFLFVLSAKSKEQLKIYAKNIKSHIESHEDLNLADMVYTLQVGRDAMDYRLAFAADSREGVLKALEGYIEDNYSRRILTGQVKKGKDGVVFLEADEDAKVLLQTWIRKKKFEKVGELWVKGLDIDWKQLYINGRGSPALPGRISLPTYPFDAGSYWLSEEDTKPGSGTAVDTVQDNPDWHSEPESRHNSSSSKPGDRGAIKSFDQTFSKGGWHPQPVRPPAGISLQPLTDFQYNSFAKSPGPRQPRQLNTLASANISLSLSQPAIDQETNPVLLQQSNIPVELLRKQLTASLAERLNMEPGKIDLDEKFVSMGVDSIVGVEWMRVINRQYGISLTATTIYDYPTIREFAAFLAKEEIASPALPDAEIEKESKKEEKIEDRPAGQSVVDLYEVEPGIVRLTMQDRLHKNMFSRELILGLKRSFESIRANPGYKVVILTGYDSYFASGGTEEALLSIQEGKSKFTDMNVFSLALECKIPVIAAMQGHAIGAGWSMGMYCDFIVMSRESVYTSNYMKYGFTPGAGATLIFPEKFGIGLAQEILFTGKQFRGAELESRGVPFLVLPREEVLPYSLQLAKTLAQSPVESLIALKDHMAGSIREKVSAVFERELQMHEKTFVNQPGVKDRIHSLFHGSAANKAESKPSKINIKDVNTPAISVEKSAVSSAVQGDAIAVIGMSGQFPGAKTLAVFWDNLAQGRDCISEIPAGRWSLEKYYDPDPDVPGKTYCKWMGALEEVDCFDPLFFNISPSEAELMDPEQRLFLENSWRCIEDAGLRPSSLSGSRCGVFVGCIAGDYGQLLQERGLNAQGFLGGSNSILSARIAYLLNLKGPSIAIDTACSSSLAAIIEACNSLKLENCDLALAGGVSVMAGPSMHIMTSKAGMLSRDGRCFTFDNRANGFVPGEGVGVILLKRLCDAVRDEDHIYGVIRGWGLNQDGKTNGITAPSVNSQILLEKEVYQRFNIDPGTISLIEAHGTGTKLGDPIEVQALNKAFRGCTSKQNYCALGSVKSNIGHLLTAAGAAGVIKVLLAIQHRMLPPTIHFENLNEHISLEDSPFFINSQLKPWEADPGTVRRAAVSSFGFSGTNAHIVLEEYLPGADASRPSIQIDTTHPLLFVLSAKSKDQLKIYAENIKSYIESCEDLNLADMVYTLQVGRDDMEYRLAFAADSRESIITALEGFIGNNTAVGILTARVDKNKDKENDLIPDADEDVQALLESWIRKKKLKKIAGLWVKGFDLDWDQLYGDNKPRRISLPSYPFAREHYWLPGTDLKLSADTAAAPAEEPLDKERAAHRNICFLRKEWEPWEPVPGSGTGTEVINRTIAILTTSETRELAAQLSRHFPGSHIVDLEDPDDLESQLQQPENEWKKYGGCVDLVGCGKKRIREVEWMAWLRGLLEHGDRERLMVLCVTRGLESYRNSTPNLTGALGAGLYRMLQSEYSYLRSRHMDVDFSSEDSELVGQIASEFIMDTGEPEVCYREGKRYLACLREYPTGDNQDRPLVFPDKHVLLITGGTRGLGYLCAEHFVTHYGVKHLVLTGREEMPPRDQWESYSGANPSIARKIQAVQGLEARGVQVRVLSVSLTDEHAMRQCLQEIKGSMGPIGGVIHSAGTANLDNPAFIRKSTAGIQRVLAPKINGLDIMVKLLKNEPLEFFVLFSSVSGIIPVLGIGQSDYAMANSYMDYIAEANRRSYPIISIQWPSWKETGMGEVKSRLYRQTGLLSLTDEEGLNLLDRILSGKPGPVILPAKVDPGLWEPHQLMRRSIRENIPAIPPGIPVSSGKALLPAVEPVKAVQTWLISLFSKELKIAPSKLDLDTSFQDYGVDSILLAQLLRKIKQQLALPGELDPSILYEYPTIESLAAWLVDTQAPFISKVGNENLSPTKTKVPGGPGTFFQKGSRPAGAKGGDIAVVGLSCRFPGASNPEEYWRLLSEGRSAIGPVPRERWGYSNSFYAGLLDNITDFDGKFFLLAEDDTRAMDPQALLVLEESLNLFYHAGYSLREIKGKAVGVYLGADGRHQPDEIILNRARNPIVAVGQNYLAANISQFFDLHGPAVVLNTACSSALAAMNMAIPALISGEINSALVGGVSLLNTDVAHRMFQRRKLLSTGNSFHIFDRRAGGVVLGEGVGMVLLKTVDQAVEDGDRIYAVIKALAINNDGRTAGPATPNLQAQKGVMQAALAKGTVKPGEISYVEANGSGSQVTDLLELKAIRSVYRSSGGAPCGLGSMKPNIGHLLCAEGIAGFIKVVLMLQHRQWVPFLSGQKPIEHFDLESSPFYFCRKLTEWINSPRIAAINCFADGGTNAHVILQAREEVNPNPGPGKRHPLSPPPLNRQPVRQCTFEIPTGIDKEHAYNSRMDGSQFEKTFWHKFQ